MKLSFPSIDQILHTIYKVFKRFPLVVIVSLIGTITAIWLIDISFASQEEYPRLLAVSFISALGISFFIAIATFLEQKEWSWLYKISINAVGTILLLIYYFSINDKLSDGPSEVFYRFLVLVLGSHLLVAFSPFIRNEKLDQFWEYNKTLFLRILVSVLYSGVLFVGLSIALLAIDNLLGLEINGETYAQLFFILGGIFNTWFFLSGVPEKDTILEKKIVFPTGLRIFVQYVLIPLVTVYIFILYLYLGKIIMQWDLPNGWVSNLVLSFSIAGILSLLLLYPIRNSNEYKWVSFYSKFYYIALIPLIGLLMLSIWIRISEYGVTINRYFVATLGVWLTGIVIYFIISKAKSIKVIPISLCLITLGVSFGPMGAFAVSERSQLGRFEEIIQRNGMLKDSGIILKMSEEVSYEDRKELSSITSFMFENHGAKSFNRYFDDVGQSSIDTMKSANQLFELMGLEFVTRWQSDNGDEQYFYYSSENTWAIEVEEYDIYLRGIVLNPTADSVETMDSDSSRWKISIKKNELELLIQEEESGQFIKIELKPMVQQIREKYINNSERFDLPITEMQFDRSNEDFEIKMFINSISGTYGNNVSLTNTSLDILIKLNR